MANLEILALDTLTPQIRAPGAADVYAAPRDIVMDITTGKGYWFGAVGGSGMQTNNGVFVDIICNGNPWLRVDSSNSIVTLRASFGIGLNLATADVGLARNAAKILKVTDGAGGGGVIVTPTFTVATLPAAAANTNGARSIVTDASVVAAGNFGTIVAGAGANIVPVYCDGTNWRIG